MVGSRCRRGSSGGSYDGGCPVGLGGSFDDDCGRCCDGCDGEYGGGFDGSCHDGRECSCGYYSGVGGSSGFCTYDDVIMGRIPVVLFSFSSNDSCRNVMLPTS